MEDYARHEEALRDPHRTVWSLRTAILDLLLVIGREKADWQAVEEEITLRASAMWDLASRLEYAAAEEQKEAERYRWSTSGAPMEQDLFPSDD
jgi:hypothetical protein